VVTNLVIQFLQIDRSDPKKFQVLQVIAGMLDWNDDEREKAGLARPGTSSSSLRLPSSPFGRTPSTPSLSAEFNLESSASGPAHNSKSLSTMFKAFLEESVHETLPPADDPLLLELLGTRPSSSSILKQPGAKSPESKPDEARPSEKAGEPAPPEKPDKA
jgi:hypothetical protein